MAGQDPTASRRRRTWIDWLVVSVATVTIVGFALVARPPQIDVNWGWGAALVIATLAMLVAAGSALWKATRFN
jgi:hypothetical protein